MGSDRAVQNTLRDALRNARGASENSATTEAGANWMARPLLTGGLAVLFAATLLGVTVAESNAATDVRRYEDDLIATGYATLFVQAGPQSLTALTEADCTAIAGLGGVRAGFALLRQTVYHRWTAAGPVVPTILATGDVVDYFRVVEPIPMRQWHAGQAFVDPDSAAAAGTTSEYLLRLAADDDPAGGSGTEWGAAAPPSTVTALAVPLASLGTGSVGSTMLVTHHSGGVQSCVVFADLDARPAVAAAVETALPAASGFSHQWALAGADNLDPPRQRFEQRPSQYYWLGAVVFFTALWVLQLRIRRADHALYAVVGLQPAGMTTMIIIELAITLAAAAGTAVVVVLVTTVRPGSYDSLSIGADAAGRALVGTAICAAAWSWQHAQNTTGTTLSALKDR